MDFLNLVSGVYMELFVCSEQSCFLVQDVRLASQRMYHIHSTLRRIIHYISPYELPQREYVLKIL